MMTPLTAEGRIVGTYQYMAPEQILGQAVDGRADIFALVAVLYEMVTGQRAFKGKNQITVMSAVLESEPEPISTLKAITFTLDHAVQRCLAKDPEERWQSARDLALELKWWLVVSIEPRNSTLFHIALLAASGNVAPVLLLETKDASVASGQVSPDEHWIAYRSGDSPRYEIYISSFPNPTGRFQCQATGE